MRFAHLKTHHGFAIPETSGLVNVLFPTTCDARACRQIRRPLEVSNSAQLSPAGWVYSRAYEKTRVLLAPWSPRLFMEFHRMYGSFVAGHLRVEVKHRRPAPNAYTWEIFREREPLPVEESIHRFGSWEEASQAGKKELRKLSAD
jgi:hypothetical protein